ncbi:PREDICTED: protein FAM3A-like, partial [Pseudopodoces humilis]|uniref:protein FAM3A-like n=1 Tax=Pseudopodoces humilis TaxID=181119 RepID=UPI0006B6FA91
MFGVPLPPAFLGRFLFILGSFLFLGPFCFYFGVISSPFLLFPDPIFETISPHFGALLPPTFWDNFPTDFWVFSSISLDDFPHFWGDFPTFGVSPDVEDLLRFLRPLHEGTLVLVASYDDPATKLTEESRRLFGELGSAVAKDLGFRDSWVFVGAKGVQDRSPFEQHVRNSRGSNKYEGWPEALELGGCVPRRPPGGPQPP